MGLPSKVRICVSGILAHKNTCFSSFIFLSRQEHQSLLEKLSALEKKVIVGGVDLLAKAEEQEKLLEESNMELEERRNRAEKLRKELEEKEVQFDSFLISL